VPRVTTNWRQWSIGGRIGTVVVGALLIALAWPGWLHATTGRGEAIGRRVAWRMELEPSLVKAAQQLQQWHEQGVLSGDDHGLNFSLEIAPYCAWFAPDEKTYLDLRLSLFESAAADYVAANKALILDPDASSVNLKIKLEPLVEILRRRHINHLMFHYPDMVG